MMTIEQLCDKIININNLNQNNATFGNLILNETNETATVMSRECLPHSYLSYTKSVIRVIINHKIAHVCETDQMVEFHIALILI